MQKYREKTAILSGLFESAMTWNDQFVKAWICHWAVVGWKAGMVGILGDCSETGTDCKSLWGKFPGTENLYPSGSGLRTRSMQFTAMRPSLAALVLPSSAVCLKKRMHRLLVRLRSAWRELQYWLKRDITSQHVKNTVQFLGSNWQAHGRMPALAENWNHVFHSQGISSI